MPDIQPQHINLQTLLSKRLFRIPRYQRSYSWAKKQRQDLFNDIKQSYVSEGPTDHFMSTIVALRQGSVKIVVTEYQKVDIVDGQQRITTLVLLLNAIARELDSSVKTQKDVRDQIEETLIKADEASQLLLQTNHDTDDHFAKYIREGLHDDVENAKTLAGLQLLMAMDECESFVRDWLDEGYSLVDLVDHLFNSLTFIYHEINDERLVYTVFEVLNSRGLEVSWFDRLKSMLMAIVFEASTGNEEENISVVHRLWGDIYGIVGLRIGMSTESLRCAATLYNDWEPSKPLGEEQAAGLLHEKASSGPGDVIEVTEWIRSVTRAVDKLHENRRINAVTRIQQARLVATAINLRTDFDAAAKERILRHWEKVSFRIYGMGRKDARTAVGSYTRLAWRITNGQLSAKRIIEELGNIGRDHPIEIAIRQLKQSNCYEDWQDELRYFFHRYEEYLAKQKGQNFENEHWNHIWAVSASQSVEHVKPQSSNTQYVHWLGKLTLLPPKVNSKLGDREPKEKVEAYKDTGMRIAVKVAQECSDGWTREKVLSRERKLLEWASKEWAG